MARNSSFSTLLVQAARAAARAEKAQMREVSARQRAMERAMRESAKAKLAVDKESKLRYLESRTQESNLKNELVNFQILELEAILKHGVENSGLIIFEDLKIKEPFLEPEIPDELSRPIPKPQEETFKQKIAKVDFFEKIFFNGEERYKNDLEIAKNQYAMAYAEYEELVTKKEEKKNKWLEEVEQTKQEHDKKIAKQHEEIDDFEKAYRSGDPEAVVTYCTMVLEQSKYPEGFPQEFRIAYVPESKEIVIEYELPTLDVIPPVAEYKYVKTRDVIDEKQRKPSEIKDYYQDIVFAVCLRTIHEIFKFDQSDSVHIVVFNGFVQAVDPATGNDIRPCIISVRTTKEKFGELNLSRVDKRSCLRNLGAQVSPQPDELLPVKPIVEFDMVDKRFVEQSDVLSDLQDRPNLMSLNPFEFENLVSNLFGQIGFQSRLTRSSRDGGVDAIAFDPRPILGGKVVIQAKRYKNVVGVSAVRDLYGTMINEGASKGILVTTSHYGTDAYNFAKDKPIELIDGGGLLYLLEQQGIKAKIIFPED